MGDCRMDISIVAVQFVATVAGFAAIELFVQWLCEQVGLLGRATVTGLLCKLEAFLLEISRSMACFSLEQVFHRVIKEMALLP